MLNGQDATDVFYALHSYGAERERRGVEALARAAEVRCAV